jgi:acetate kinase
LAMDALVLAANPGSSSRKYAIYKNQAHLASLHFEYEDDRLVCTVISADKPSKHYPDSNSLDDCLRWVGPMLAEAGVEFDGKVNGIGLRIVAPTEYFLQDRLLDNETLSQLTDLKQRAPLHIAATLEEAKQLKEAYQGTPIVAVSDSAFHVTKPDYAWNYAIPLEDADRLGIKRFGFHGISISSVVKTLTEQNKLPENLVVCHLGSGASVTAVKNGQSLDTTMGYSPLEGLIMATRCGSIDVIAAMSLKMQLGLNELDFETYLNKQSGLLGVSGSSSDIRSLLVSEQNGDYKAGLALRMYVYKVAQAVAQMAVTLNGVDAVLFTGTVGVRATNIRKRVVESLEFLGLSLDEKLNQAVIEPKELTTISSIRHKPIYVLTTNESREIAQRTLEYISKN